FYLMTRHPPSPQLFPYTTLFRSGVVAVAWHVNQAGVEAVIRVAPHQQAHRAPLVQVDHPAHDVDEIGDPGLKELIARIGLQHVQHRLAVAAARAETEVLDDALDFPAPHRDIA